MSRGASARMFVAVDPPEQVRDELLAWARRAVAVSARQQGPAVANGKLYVRGTSHLFCYGTK